MPNDNSQYNVFISYSHRDEKLKDELLAHLSPLVRLRTIDAWDDRRIRPGDDWKSEIDSALRATDIALLLISSDFLNSDFCMDVEVPDLLARHESVGVRIVPIVLRACIWTHVPCLARFQALPPDGKPITETRPRDKALEQVSRAIADLCSS